MHAESTAPNDTAETGFQPKALEAAAQQCWDAAKAWAATAGGELPTRQEQALLYANLKAEFKPAWYWSSEQHASDSSFAWHQNFYDGYQHSYHESYAGRARAVRRFPA